jgi:hypothetical protein
MRLLLNHIEQGQVYRRSDLEYYSTSIDRDLVTLTQNGYLLKINPGLYYSPKKTKFGIVPPDAQLLIECFLKDDDFLIISPNFYNVLNLGLTQLYNVTWVYNHKRKGQIELHGTTFNFKIKSSFPREISKEFLLVDLLNNLRFLAEDQLAIINKLNAKLFEFDRVKLTDAIQRYGTGATKQLLKSFLRKSNKND